MIEQHPSFIEPAEDTIIWRYFDFPKFVSFLQNSSLFFSRIDYLNDPMEGAIQKYRMSLEADKYEQNGNIKMADNIRHNVANISHHLENYFIPTTYVNCWCMSEYESFGMWKLYVREFGVAIQSHYNKLRSELNDNAEVTIYIGKVNYIDFTKEMVPFNNSFNHILYKRIFFNYENEIRAVIWDRDIEKYNAVWNQVWEEVRKGRFPELQPYLKSYDNKEGWTFSPEESSEASRFRMMLENARSVIVRELYQPGINVRIDIANLIEAVHTSPNAPEWFQKVVYDLIGNYLGSHVRVLKSGLDSPL